MAIGPGTDRQRSSKVGDTYKICHSPSSSFNDIALWTPAPFTAGPSRPTSVRSAEDPRIFNNIFKAASCDMHVRGHPVVRQGRTRYPARYVCTILNRCGSIAVEGDCDRGSHHYARPREGRHELVGQVEGDLVAREDEALAAHDDSAYFRLHWFRGHVGGCHGAGTQPMGVLRVV